MTSYDNYWELPPGVKLSARRHQIYHDVRKAAAEAKTIKYGDPIEVLRTWPGANQADKRAVAWPMIGFDEATRLFPVNDPEARRKIYNAGDAAIALVKAASPEGIRGVALRAHGDDLRNAAFVLGVGKALDKSWAVDAVRAALVRRLIRSLDACGPTPAARDRRYRQLLQRIGQRCPLLHTILDAMAAGLEVAV